MFLSPKLSSSEVSSIILTALFTASLPSLSLSCVGELQFLGWGGEEVRGQVADIWSLTSGVWERTKVWPTHFKGMLQARSRARRNQLRDQSI